MNFKETVTRSLRSACTIYTVITVLLLCLKLLISGYEEDVIIEPTRFLLVLPFSIFAAFGFTFMKYEKAPKWARVICQYFCLVVGFFLFMYLPGAGSASDGDQLVALFLFTLLYLFAWLGLALIRLFIRKKKNERSDYKDLYK